MINRAQIQKLSTYLLPSSGYYVTGTKVNYKVHSPGWYKQLSNYTEAHVRLHR